MGPEIEKAISSLLPLLRQFTRGKHAICLGGSLSKGKGDAHSDIDLYLFADEAVPIEERKALVAAFPGSPGEIHADFDFKTCWWGTTTDFTHGGFKIETSLRSIERVDEVVAQCLKGKIEKIDTWWNPHGFYNYVWLADLHDARILEDPQGLLTGWKSALDSYPQDLKKAQIEWHLQRAKFWLDNFHYKSAVKRGDLFYTAGIVQGTLHHLIQYLFALNEIYYGGDKRNIEAVEAMKLRPQSFMERSQKLLLGGDLEAQRQILRDLVLEGESLGNF